MHKILMGLKKVYVCVLMYAYTYIYKHTHIYMYIYTEREEYVVREKDGVGNGWGTY